MGILLSIRDLDDIGVIESLIIGDLVKFIPDGLLVPIVGHIRYFSDGGEWAFVKDIVSGEYYRVSVQNIDKVTPSDLVAQYGVS